MLLKNAWDDLAGKFKVKMLIEITPVRFKGMKRMWLLRLGRCVVSPVQIWNQKKKAPPKLVTRQTSSFVTEQLISILKKSNLFSMLLSTSYYCSLTFDGNQKKYESDNTIEEVELNEKEKNNIVPFKIKDGTRADKKIFPVLARFGVPIDNEQTASALLTELIKLRSMQENDTTINIKKN